MQWVVFTQHSCHDLLQYQSRNSGKNVLAYPKWRQSVVLQQAFFSIVFTAIMAAEELPNFAIEFDCLQATSTQRKSLSEKELDEL